VTASAAAGRPPEVCGGPSSDRRARAHLSAGAFSTTRMRKQAGTAGGRRTAGEATATVTWCGCRTRGFFEGYEQRRGDAQNAQETRRTPGSAAGCNKPATSGDGEPSRWCETTWTAPVPDLAIRDLAVETPTWPGPGGMSMEGRTDESQERRPATLDFGPIAPARAERRLRRGGEGHGGAADRATDRASMVGSPRRPGSGWCTTAARAVGGHPHGTNGHGGGGEGQRPATTPTPGVTDRISFDSRSTGASHRVPRGSRRPRQPHGSRPGVARESIAPGIRAVSRSSVGTSTRVS